MDYERADVAAQRRRAFGKWLADRCGDAGFRTQQDAADAIGVSRVQVARWMAGMSKPNEENMPAIARALSDVACEYDVYRRAGHAIPEGVAVPHPRDELSQIFESVPPLKQPAFLKVARTLAEAMSP